MTYLIPFACYGRLHGAAAGSVDRWHNAPGTPLVEEHPARTAFEEERMDQLPYTLDLPRRDLVLQAIQGVVHTVVEAEARPERIMNDFKAYASRHPSRMALEAAPCLGGNPVRRCRAG